MAQKKSNAGVYKAVLRESTSQYPSQVKDSQTLDKVLRRPAGKKALNKAVKAGVKVQNDAGKNKLYSYVNTDGDVDAAPGSFRGSYAPNRASGRGINLAGLYQGKQFQNLGVGSLVPKEQLADTDPEDARFRMNNPAMYGPGGGLSKVQDKIMKKVVKRISKAKKSDALGASRKKK